MVRRNIEVLIAKALNEYVLKKNFRISKVRSLQVLNLYKFILIKPAGYSNNSLYLFFKNWILWFLKPNLNRRTNFNSYKKETSNTISWNLKISKFSKVSFSSKSLLINELCLLLKTWIKYKHSFSQKICNYLSVFTVWDTQN